MKKNILNILIVMAAFFSVACDEAVESSTSDTGIIDEEIEYTINDESVSDDEVWSSEKITAVLENYLTFDDALSINDESVSTNEVWSSNKINSMLENYATTADVAAVNEKMRVIKGEYYGGPAYASGTPFCFNINNLATDIVDANVFVVASGFKTASAGNLLSSLQITWNVTTSGSDHIVELYVEDAEGNPYVDPGDVGAWDGCKVKLKFHAYYVPAMPDAVFIP